jgi:hypothetical protein
MRKARTPSAHPFDLIVQLTGACLRTLRPNAWKVVSVVAIRVLVIVRREWNWHNDPKTILHNDISKIWPDFPHQPIQVYEDPTVEFIAGDSPDSPYPTIPSVPISLTEFCSASGLSRSSTASAIRQAVSVGVLKKIPRKDFRNVYAPSHYAIDWNWVSEAAKKEEKRLRSRARRRRRREKR